VDGNLQLNGVGATTYEFGELSSTVSTGGISGHAANGSPTTSTLRVGALDTNSTFSGIIVDLPANNAATGNLDNAANNLLALEKVGTGTLTLSGANTFTGGITVSAGTLATSAAGRLAATVAPDVASGATLSLGGDQTLAVVTGSGTLDLSAGTLSVGATTGEFGGTITGPGELVSTLFRTESGTLDLAGTSQTFSAVTDTAGTIALAAGTLTVTNATTNTFAGGITGSGGLVKAAAGNLVLSGINNYTGPTSLGTAADLLVVNGALNIAAGTLLEFSDLAGLSTQPFVEDSTVFAMINYTGTWNNGLFTYNTQTLANGSRFMVGSQMWEIDYAYVYNTENPNTLRPLNFQGSHVPGTGTQTFVTITAVPEPATLALLAAAAAGLAGLALPYRRPEPRGRTPRAARRLSPESPTAPRKDAV